MHKCNFQNKKVVILIYVTIVFSPNVCNNNNKSIIIVLWSGPKDSKKVQCELKSNWHGPGYILIQYYDPKIKFPLYRQFIYRSVLHFMCPYFKVVFCCAFIIVKIWKFIYLYRCVTLLSVCTSNLNVSNKPIFLSNFDCPVFCLMDPMDK